MTPETNGSIGIQCSPKELCFKHLSQGEKQKSTLTLSNPTRSRYAFKVKTTCPKCYVVKPSVGFLEPESTFKITLIKQRNPKPTIVDKFLIEAMTTSEKRTNTADAQMRSANKVPVQEVRLIKVPVILEGPSTDIDSSKGLHAKTKNKTGESTVLEPSISSSTVVPIPLPQSLPQAPSPSIETLPHEIRPTTSARDGLIVMNNNLSFRYNAGSAAASHIRLYNPTDDRLAFKVKNTFPRGFKVKPSQGFIKPRSSAEIEVLLLSCRGLDFSYSKFLVQSFVVDFSDEIITEAMYHKAKLYKAVRETELDVKLIGFDEDETCESASIVEEKNAAAAYEIRYLRKQLMSMESELQILKKQIFEHKEEPVQNKPENTSTREPAACVGCMHSSPFFRTRKNRRSLFRFAR